MDTVAYHKLFMPLPPAYLLAHTCNRINCKRVRRERERERERERGREGGREGGRGREKEMERERGERKIYCVHVLCSVVTVSLLLSSFLLL